MINKADDMLSNLNLSATLKQYVSTYITLLVNVVLIPFLIDVMVLLEDFETRYDRQLAILNRNMLFMLLNSVFIPLTNSTSIADLAK